MATALSSLTVQADYDASRYVAGANQKAAADQQMIASGAKLSDSLDLTQRKLSDSGTGFDRFVRSIDPAAASAAKFETGMARVQGALAAGMISTERAAELIAILEQRYASATKAINDNNAALNLAASVADAYNNSLTGIVTMQERLSVSLAGMSDAVKAAYSASITPIDQTTQAISRNYQASITAGQADRDALATRLSVAAAYSASLNPIQNLTAATNEEIAAAQRYRDQLNPLIVLQKAYADEIVQINQLGAAGLLTDKERIASLQTANGTYQNAVAGIKSVTGATAENTQAFSLNRAGLQELQAAGINSFQALAAGMSPLRVATMEGAQVFGAFAQGGLGVAGALRAIVSPMGLAVAATAGLVAGFIAVVERANDDQAALRQYDVILTGMGESSLATSQQLEAMAKSFRDTGVSATEATAAIQEVMRAGLNPASALGVATTGQNIGTILGGNGIQTLTSALQGGVNATVQLGFQLRALTVDEAANALEMAAHGQQGEALNQVFAKIQGSVQGMHDRALTPAQAATDALAKAWDNLMETLANSSGIQAAERAITQLMTDLSNLISKGQIPQGNLLGAALTVLMPEVGLAVLAGQNLPGASSIGQSQVATGGVGAVSAGPVGSLINVNIPQQYAASIASAASQYGIPADLLAGLLASESGFTPNAIGPMTKYGQAQGIAQFMAPTAAQYGVNVNDPISSIYGAAHYLSDLYSQSGGSYQQALIGYLSGNVNNPLSIVQQSSTYYKTGTIGLAQQYDAAGTGGVIAGATGPANPLGSPQQQQAIAQTTADIAKQNEIIAQNNGLLEKSGADLQATQAYNQAYRDALEKTGDASLAAQAGQTAYNAVLSQVNGEWERGNQLANLQISLTEQVAAGYQQGIAEGVKAQALAQATLEVYQATGKASEDNNVTQQKYYQILAQNQAAADLFFSKQDAANNNQVQVLQLEASMAGQSTDQINAQVSLLQAKQQLQAQGLTDADAEYQKHIANVGALAQANIQYTEANQNAQRVNSTLTSIGNTIDSDITNNLEAAFDGQKITNWGTLFHQVIAQIEAQLISLSVIKPAIGSVLSLLGFTGAAQSFGSLFSGAGLLSGLGGLFGGSSSSSTGAGQVLKDKDGNVIGTLSNVGSLANSGSNLFGGSGGAFSNITSWLNGSIGPSLGFSPYTAAQLFPGATAAELPEYLAANPGILGDGLFAGTTLTGALGYAGIGGTVGSLAGLITGNTGIGSTILGGVGGLVGGLAGSALLGSVLGSFAGPLGSVAGGLLGNLLGGLFGGKPANNESATNINLTNGQVGALSSNGVAQSDQDVQQMASAFSSFVQELLQILPQGTLPGGNIIPQSGTRDGIKVVLGMGDNGENTYSFPDVNTAINSIEQQIIQGLDLSQVGPTLRQVLSTVTDPSQLQAAVQFASAYDNLAQATQTALSSIQGLPQSIQDLKTGVAGPFEQAINQVNSTFATISQQAQQFGLSLDPVNDALAKATATLQGDFKTALQNAYDQSVNGGSDFIDQAKAAFGTFSENQREAGALGIGDDATVIKQNTAIYESALNSIFSALSPTQLQQVQTAFGGIDENLQQLTQSLIAAGGGAAYLAQQTNFAYSVNQDYLNATGQGYLAQLNDLDKTAQAALAQLPTLGLSSSGKEATQIQETEHQSALTILEGLTPDQLDQARQALDALNPAFDKWIDEAKAAVAATQALTQAQAAQSFQYSAMQDYYNAVGEGFIAQLNDLDKTAQAALAQLPSLGLSPTGIEAQQIQETEHQSALTILEGLNPTQLDQARQALDALNPAFGQWVDEANKAIAATNAAAQAAADQAAAQQQLNNVLQAGAQIRDYLNSLQTGQSAYTSPASALSAAQSQYQTELGLARSGDLTALQGITNAAQALLQASSAYYASSAQGQAIFQEVQADLAALPGVLNASQTQANPVGTITSGNQTISLTGTAAAVTDGASAASAQAINAVNDNILALGNHIDLAGTSTVNAISTGASAVSSHVDQLQGSFDAVRASIDQLRADWDNFGSTLKSVLAAINNLTAMSAAGFGQIAAGLGAINDNNVANARALVNAIG